MSTLQALDRLEWRKSSFSTGGSNGGTTCVEVAFDRDVVAARDSKAPADGVLVVPVARWSSFLDGVRAGRFQG